MSISQVRATNKAKRPAIVFILLLALCSLLAICAAGGIWLARPPDKIAFPDPTQKIVFTGLEAGRTQIYAMNADGSQQANLTRSTAYDASASVSRDGARFAFQSNRNGNWDIYVMNADGSQQIQLTTSPADEVGPHWSPDGGRIAFVTTHDRNNAGTTHDQIYIMNADGTHATNISSNLFDDDGPDWSPDASRIVFHSKRDGHWGIYTMNAEGSQLTRLSNEEDDFAVWSPDGARIVFTSNRGQMTGNSQIYVMDANGAHQARVAANVAQEEYPSWSPDGQWIVYSSNLGDDGFSLGTRRIQIMSSDGRRRIQFATPAIGTFPVWQPPSNH